LLEAASARATRSGQVFELRCDGARAGEIAVPLVGAFNVANLLGVIGCALACGRGMDDIVALAPKLAAPPGRMQCVGGADAPLVVIDYSHTPDALDKALAALRPLARARDGKLWIVFGAGGDRDRGKRVSMGAIAARGADEVIVTSDNPRGEDPGRIAAAIIGGIPGRHQCILDRAEAIAAAVSGAADADVVLVAGKGHEQYQEISGAKRPFSDIEQARAALARRAPPQTGAGS
jgi:UDP-N-acetylmuramoyl-L-alanyl-D-glutamate--2,6-diaminopimelate ligase